MTLTQTFDIRSRSTTINNYAAPVSGLLDPHLVNALRDLQDRAPHASELDAEPAATVGLDRVPPQGAVFDDVREPGDQGSIDHHSSSPLEQPPFQPATTRHSTVEEHAAAAAPFPAAAPTNPVPTPKAVDVGTVTPYYQDDLVTLYNGDSIDLAHLWLNKAHVMITDPPYGLEGLAGAYGTTHRTIANDGDTEVRDALLHIWGDRPVAVFGTPRLPEPPGGWSDRLVWDKSALGLNGGPWRYAHESIFVRGAGWTRVSDAASSILRHSTQANRRHVAEHIHSKPVRLLMELILSAPAGTIIDPCAGGGSTVVAASLLGRPIIAVELDRDHCDTIVNRLRGQQSFDLESLG